MQPPEPTSASPAWLQRVVTVATWVTLLLLGVLLGLVGAFLVPARLLGLPGVAIVFAVVGNLAAGTLAGRGLGTRLGAAVPGIGWLAVALVAGTRRAEGDLVVPGSVPTDHAIGLVGSLFLMAGVLAAAIPVGLVGRRSR